MLIATWLAVAVAFAGIAISTGALVVGLLGKRLNADFCYTLASLGKFFLLLLYTQTLFLDVYLFRALL